MNEPDICTVLNGARLVTDDRSGTKVHYTLNRKRLAAAHQAVAARKEER